MLDLLRLQKQQKRKLGQRVHEDIYLDSDFVMFMKDNNFMDAQSVKRVLNYLLRGPTREALGAKWEDERLTQYYGNSLSEGKNKVDLIVEALRQPHLPLNVGHYKVTHYLEVERRRQLRKLPVIPSKYLGRVKVFRPDSRRWMQGHNFPNFFSHNPPSPPKKGFINWTEDPFEEVKG